MKYYTLNNGVEMPAIGLGTFLLPNERMSEIIGEAYRLGYRKFDTAYKYGNERVIAKALKDNGIKREDVFITTKISGDDLYLWRYFCRKSFLNIRNFTTIKRSILKSFRELQTDYVDLFLIHMAFPNFLKQYEELDKLYHEGRIRAIGVSSFRPPHIQALKEVSDTVPVVNQFEISPLNTQKKLIAYCHEHNIIPEAMSTFSHWRSWEPRKEIVENENIVAMAEKRSKSPVQIVCKWMVDQGISIIPKTDNPKRLAENINILDIELSDEERKTIDAMDVGQFLNYNPYIALKNLPKKYRDWKGFE